jgi:phage gpG-like protein
MENVKKRAMQRMATETAKYFGDSFPRQGLDEKWQQVQRRIPGTTAYRMASMWDRTRPILYGQTGNLRIKTYGSVTSVTPHRFVLVNPMPYAQMHNEGGKTKTGADVPARPFMKQTKELTSHQLQILLDETGRAWREIR